MKTKISSFLKERESRIKPAEANKMGLKRLNKIDFSGVMHLIHKPTNTDMILIKSGDLVISGINVEKGAVAVYQGKEDILATIHYSSYEFDETKIDIEYFKTFLKSKAFKEVINSQIRGGIKTELKAKSFLPLEINLPELKDQIKIRNRINSSSGIISELSDINNSNESYISKLRQAILQEAVQGKLVPQDPNDEPASELLKKIHKEKENLIKEGKIKKQKPLPPISDDEIPYELPRGWEWVRLGRVILSDIGGGTPSKNKSDYWNGSIPWASVKDLNENIFLTKTQDKISELGLKNSSSNLIPKDNLIICTRMGLGKILFNKIDVAINQDLRAIFLPRNIEKFYFYYFYKTLSFIHSGTTVSGIRREKLLDTLFPLPPLSEQKHIVEKVDRLMAYCDELEKQVRENSLNSQNLMNRVLKEAFVNGE